MSKREFRNIKGSGDIYSKFGIEGLQERNKNNLLDVLGAVKDVAEVAADVHPMTFQAMGTMFREMGGALRSSGMMSAALGQIMGPANQLGRSIGFSAAGMMGPSMIMANQLIHDITQPMREFTASYQTGAGIGGLIGMGIGGFLGYRYGGGAMGTMGASVGGMVGSYIGAYIERGIGGPTVEALSAWESALINEVGRCYSYGWDSGQIFIYILQQYWGNADARAAMKSLGWVPSDVWNQKPAHATPGFLAWLESHGFVEREGGGGTGGSHYPIRAPRIGGAGGGGGHARKPRERRLM